jgi:hypothetical protein
MGDSNRRIKRNAGINRKAACEESDELVARKSGLRVVLLMLRDIHPPEGVATTRSTASLAQRCLVGRMHTCYPALVHCQCASALVIHIRALYGDRKSCADRALGHADTSGVTDARMIVTTRCPEEQQALIIFKGVVGMMACRRTQGFSLVFEPEGEA